MNTSLEYKVHSASVDKVDVDTTFRDKPIRATVNGFTVELVGENEGNDHGHTFRFVPESDEDMEAFRDYFTLEAGIRITFEKTSEGQKRPADKPAETPVEPPVEPAVEFEATKEPA